MFILKKLDAADAADAAKLQEFVTEVNEEEARLVEADLLVGASLDFLPAGNVVAVIRASIIDLRTRAPRPATPDEVKKKLAMALRGMTP